MHKLWSARPEENCFQFSHEAPGVGGLLFESFRCCGNGSCFDKGPQPLAGNEIEDPYPHSAKGENEASRPESTKISYGAKE